MLAIAAAARWRAGDSFTRVAREIVTISLYPLAAILLFLVNSKLSIGFWFVSGGFYVPDSRLQGQVAAVTRAVWWGTWQLGSFTLVATGAIAAVALVAIAVRDRARTSIVVPLALVAVSALPWYAYFEGHPFRIRYMVPLVAAAIAAASASEWGCCPAGSRASSPD